MGKIYDRIIQKQESDHVAHFEGIQRHEKTRKQPGGWEGDMTEGDNDEFAVNMCSTEKRHNKLEALFFLGGGTG